MEVLINSKTDVNHEIEIIVPYEELRPLFEKAYRDEAKDIAIPGFRRGKAPIQIIRKRFGQAIEYQVIEKLSNDYFRTALEERNIVPIGQPVLHTLDYEPGGALTIKVNYETAPDVTVRDYKGVQLEKFVHTVTDEEVEDEILGLRKSQRTLTAAEIPTDENYLVTIDIQMLDDEGQPVPGKRNENMKVDLGDEQMSRDLISELYNMKAGEEKDVEFTHEHEDHEHVERARILVKTVEQVTLPEMTDEFAATVSQGQAETVDALYAFVRARLEEIWLDRYDRQLEQDLVNEIVKRNAFEVPQTILDNILDDMVKQLQDYQPDKKLPDDFNQEEYRKRREPEAKFTGQWMFIRDALIEAEGINVGDEDLEEKAAKDSEATGIDKERLVEFYKKSPQYTQNILVEKLLQALLSFSDIKEIDDNDISKTGLAPLDMNSFPHAHDHDHDHEHGHDHEHSSVEVVEDADSADEESK